MARGRTVEEREREMISLAVDLAEKQLREGTASAAVIQHYLKLGATAREIISRSRSSTVLPLAMVNQLLSFGELRKYVE